MHIEDANQADRLCRHIESLRPSWRVSYVEAAADQLLITVRGAKGALMDTPMTYSLTRIRTDFWGAGRDLVRKAERLATIAGR